MARKKKFTQPGETEQRIRWNKAKTRKWLTEYTVLEVHPSKNNMRNGKKEVTEEKPKATKSKKTTKSRKTKPTKRKSKAAQKKG